jgi:hypothetical protein
MLGRISSDCLVVGHGKSRENSLLSSFRREEQKQKVTKNIWSRFKEKIYVNMRLKLRFHRNAKVAQMRKFTAAWMS